MEEKHLSAIIGGLLVFLIILFFMIYVNSDFDQQLVNDVDKGVPADKLIPKIEKENIKDNLKINERINSQMMNINMWGNGNLVVEDDYNKYELIYYSQIKLVSDHEKLRKQFVRREISKEEFLIKVKEYNDDLNRLAM